MTISRVFRYMGLFLRCSSFETVLQYLLTSEAPLTEQMTGIRASDKSIQLTLTGGHQEAQAGIVCFHFVCKQSSNKKVFSFVLSSKFPTHHQLLQCLSWPDHTQGLFQGWGLFCLKMSTIYLRSGVRSKNQKFKFHRFGDFLLALFNVVFQEKLKEQSTARTGKTFFHWPGISTRGATHFGKTRAAAGWPGC